MNRFFSRLGTAYRNSTVHRVFFAGDDRGKGRMCMLLVSVFGGLAGQLSGGFFYTGFLVGYGIDIVGIGMITFIPSICSLLSLFSPLILERFKKRRLILAAGRLLYYFISIVGITLLPVIIKNPDRRLAGFIIILVLANSVNSLLSPGYSAWHANFLPDEIRADYFTASSCISSFFTFAVVYALSVVTDSLKGSPRQLELIIIFRYIAFIIAIIDVIVISLPKEYKYEHSGQKIHIADIFSIPVKNKPFLLTTVILVIYCFFNNLPNATINTFLLQDIGISYALMNGINATYFIFFIVFGSFWKKFIARNTWFRALAFSLLMLGITQLTYSFVDIQNKGWLFLVVRFSQHIVGVVVNTSISAVPYVNLPDTDRTSYFAFNTITMNAASFLGLMTGTYFTKAMGDATLSLAGHVFAPTSILLALCGTGEVLLCIAILPLVKIITPKYVLDTYYAEKAHRRALKESRRAG